MGLQVQLADPDGQLAGFLMRLGEILLRQPLAGGGQARIMRRAAQVLQHLLGRPAPAVAVAKGEELLLIAGFLLVGLPRPGELLRVGRAAVAAPAQLGDMRHHPAAVNALPPEQVVRKLVPRLPVQFPGPERAQPAARQNLRQPRIIPENIRQPAQRRPRPEFLLAKLDAVQHLPDERLTGGDIGVRLHPHGPGGLPASRRDLRLDFLIQRRVMLLDVRVQLRLGAGEAVLGVAPHQPAGRRESAPAFADGLPDRPQPGGVDMGVPGHE